MDLRLSSPMDPRRYQNDKLHRTDGPAFEDADGDNRWYQTASFIEPMDLRLNTLMEPSGGTKTTSFIEPMDPRLNDADGYKAWYLNGELHRTDGPAVEYADGTKWWYQNGKRHRTDGPAIEVRQWRQVLVSERRDDFLRVRLEARGCQAHQTQAQVNL
jgi:hypothetical protein